ncbi:MAG: hypothetical protein CMB22_00350 [Euryarchaeota archaeon]|jgi:hypothetical protein|nr:hypothetical protein [Euryarchaeota archaeon]|tara:strand:+ start:666 stop:1046 length:381 start_codon:yes stop_codon:yes gene_type:complete
MVRARKQPARAATGQEYGAAKEQMDAQREVPLPQEVQMMPRPGAVNPADTPDPFGPTARPNESISAAPMPVGGNAPSTGHTAQRAQKLGVVIPSLLATMGSSDFTTAATRKILRQYEASLPPSTDE